MPRKASYTDAVTAALLASMRPGLLCPGKQHRTHCAAALARRFNEAGAVMPRKGPPMRWSFFRAPCFNEAGAVMPRKAVQRFQQGRRIGASMRPGLLCPGKFVTLTVAPEYYALQ